MSDNDKVDETKREKSNTEADQARVKSNPHVSPDVNTKFEERLRDLDFEFEIAKYRERMDSFEKP